MPDEGASRRDGSAAPATGPGWILGPTRKGGGVLALVIVSTFVVLLLGSILLIGVLTYVPALALGPVVEHFMLLAAK